LVFVSLWLYLLLSVISTGELIESNAGSKPFQLQIQPAQPAEDRPIVLRRRGDGAGGSAEKQRALNVPERYIMTPEVVDPPSLEEVKRNITYYLRTLHAVGLY